MSSAAADESVDVDFDQPRRLYFDLGAMKALDRVMGEVGISQAMALLRALNFQTLERVLWAGFLHEEPNLSVNIVAKRLKAYTDAGRSTADLFVAAHDALNSSKVFGGKDADQGNARPEATTQN
jgi:hypothetical protein